MAMATTIETASVTLPAGRGLILRETGEGNTGSGLWELYRTEGDGRETLREPALPFNEALERMTRYATHKWLELYESESGG